jgi:hypothetical protein
VTAAARVAVISLTIVLVLALRPVSAYSVLAHESNVDAVWESHIRPLLHQKFPSATPEDLLASRAYAYGGSLIQDMGYYPFGSHFFTDLVHYVKTGDFIEALLRDARDVNDYAFALGALGHYASDTQGHALAVNRALPLLYPKLRRKYGDVVAYEDAPKHHIMVEFAFDVLLVANGGYKLQAYHDFIGFEISKPLLERAFQETYGLPLHDVFLSEDLAIASYRHAVGTTIPNATKVAWDKKREQIEKITPGVLREQFVLRLPRAAYEHEFGSDYQKPRGIMRLLGVLYKLVPKIGPLRPLAFKVPTPEAERLFLESLDRTRARFRETLIALRGGPLHLANLNLDTGKLAAPGEYQRADETEAKRQKRRAHAASGAYSRAVP